MFCTNCGKELPDGSLFCDACGARVSAPDEAPKSEDAQPESNTATEMNAAPQNMGAQPETNAATQSAGMVPPMGAPYTPQPVKKRKKWPIAVAVVVVVVVVAAVSVAGATSGFFVKNFGSAKAYYAYVEKNEFDDKVGDLSNWYGNIVSAQDSVNSNGVHAEAEVSIEESGLSLLSSYAGIDLSDLADLGLAVDYQSGKSSTDGQITFTVDGKDELTLTAYMDDASQLYMRVPELTDAYLMFDFSDLEDYGFDVDTSAILGGELNLSDYFSNSAELKKLALKYADAAIADVSRVSKSKETLTVEGVSEKCTVLTVKITASDVANMVKDINNLAKSDKQLASICDELADDAELLTGYREFEGDELYEEFLDALDELEDDLSDSYYYGDDEYLKMQVYVGKGNEVVGRTVSYVDTYWEEEDQIFSYKEPQSGNKFALELVIGSDYSAVSLTGSGTKTNGSLTGTYKLIDGDVNSTYASTETMATIAVDKLDREKLKKGYVDGSYTVTPGSSAMGDYAGLVAIGVTEKDSSSGTDSEISVLLNGSPIATVSIDLSYKSKASVSAPGSSADVYSIDDADEYIYDLDFDGIFDVLEDIGLPSDILSELEEEIDYMLYW